MELSVTGDLLVRETSPAVLTVTLNRPAQHNSLTQGLLEEIHAALDRAERAPDCRLVVLEGSDGVFCSGMDFEEAAAPAWGSRSGEAFLGLLKRFTSIPRVVVSKVDGRVAGGGVGLAAASDFVYATERSQFSLPEALWGLLPCCVLPFLIRRVGFQKAYSMALSTLPVGAAQAERIHLVDQLCEPPDEAIRKLSFRLSKLEEATIRELKRYCARLWTLSEETENAALDQLARLMSSTVVQRNLADFVQRGTFPWERLPGEA